MSKKVTSFNDIVLSKAEGNLLPEGQHLVTVMAIIPAEAAPKHDQWDDPTLQAKVQTKNEDGFHTEYFNLQGFEKYSELTPAQRDSGKFEPRVDPEHPTAKPYAVNIKTNMRVASNDNTVSALNIFSKFAKSCGVEADETPISDVVEQMIDKKVIINIESSSTGKMFIKSHSNADRALKASSKEEIKSRKRAVPKG